MNIDRLRPMTASSNSIAVLLNRATWSCALLTFQTLWPLISRRTPGIRGLPVACRLAPETSPSQQCHRSYCHVLSTKVVHSRKRLLPLQKVESAMCFPEVWRMVAKNKWSLSWSNTAVILHRSLRGPGQKYLRKLSDRRPCFWILHVPALTMPRRRCGWRRRNRRKAR